MPAAELYKLSEAADPTAEMLKKIGDLKKVDMAGARVLMWVYIRPNKTAGGIILTQKEVKEDVWQGAVGYVLKTGPRAFKDDAQNDFAGFSVAPGDWVLFTPGEGKRVQINGVDCKIVEDTLIQAKIADPSIITHRQ